MGMIFRANHMTVQKCSLNLSQIATKLRHKSMPQKPKQKINKQNYS